MEEKDVVVRDERKFVPPPTTRSPSPVNAGIKRPHPDEEANASTPVPTDKGKANLPAFKKNKLPTIKKRPPGGALNGSGGPSTPTTRGPSEKTGETERLALPVMRKQATMAPNADFDLRDASVYASLFQKVCG